MCNRATKSQPISENFIQNCVHFCFVLAQHKWPLSAQKLIGGGFDILYMSTAWPAVFIQFFFLQSHGDRNPSCALLHPNKRYPTSPFWAYGSGYQTLMLQARTTPGVLCLCACVRVSVCLPVFWALALAKSPKLGVCFHFEHEKATWGTLRINTCVGGIKHSHYLISHCIRRDVLRISGEYLCNFMLKLKGTAVTGSANM